MEFDAAEGEELDVLLDDGVAGFGEDADEGVLVEGGERGADGDAADEFGDEAVGLEVRWFDEVERVEFADRVVAVWGGGERVEEGEVFFEEGGFWAVGFNADGVVLVGVGV